MIDSNQMPAAPQGAPDNEMENGEYCVPLSALATPDDQETMQTPAVGDSGTAQIDYTVTRVEGENAYIKPTAINGQPLDEESENEQEPDADDQEGSQLRDMAAQMSA